MKIEKFSKKKYDSMKMLESKLTYACHCLDTDKSLVVIIEDDFIPYPWKLIASWFILSKEQIVYFSLLCCRDIVGKLEKSQNRTWGVDEALIYDNENNIKILKKAIDYCLKDGDFVSSNKKRKTLTSFGIDQIKCTEVIDSQILTLVFCSIELAMYRRNSDESIILQKLSRDTFIQISKTVYRANKNKSSVSKVVVLKNILIARKF